MPHPSRPIARPTATPHRVRRWQAVAAALVLGCAARPCPAQSIVTLSDAPVFTSVNVPGNVALVLSVEFPTAISVANLNNYSDSTTYYGYFDAAKCYTYQFNSASPASSYFQPTSFAGGGYGHSCSGTWSGNFMNWATMQTIDPFRWALTGGYRSVDTTSQTILEKAWGAAQGGLSNFPYRGTGSNVGAGHQLSSGLIGSVTPFSNWSNFTSAIWSNGITMVFSGANAYTPPTSAAPALDLSDLASANKAATTRNYQVYVRVSVCDISAMGIAGLEANCTGYGNATTSGGVTTYSIYKPTGLMQQYSGSIEFSVFSYLNQLGSVRQGGVLRAPMGFIGPTYRLPLSASDTTNARSEWDPLTGIMYTNPDTVSANGSGVSQSGAMNYLNKFGEYSHGYMTYDNVGELYYAALRYYENLGNVPEWTNGATAAELDGFPAVATWSDPIKYRCQRNFILGIGDDHTWYDYNVGGATDASGGRAKPSLVQADNVNQATNWLKSLMSVQGMSYTPWYITGEQTTYYMAGLAYGAHVTDIRPDLAGAQTVSTYWMDVAEYQRLENLNPYYLAAKFGGFTPPTPIQDSNGTPYNMQAAPPQSSWNTNNATLNMAGKTQLAPNNYFPAGFASQMIGGLRSAFASIATAIKSYSSAFSLSTPRVTSAGEISFASQFDSSNWTGVVTASTLTFDSFGNPQTAVLWTSGTAFETQLPATRNIATYNGTQGVAFQITNLNASQVTALIPSGYAPTITSSQYLNYLRGDRTNEQGSTAAGANPQLRARSLLLGDIVDASLVSVAAPVMSYSETYNPGYTAFQATWAKRPTVVYAAANDGMLHAFLGSTGMEQFAYVPSALFTGPTGAPQVSGLAALGDPSYLHHYYVDATPVAFDIDLARTGGATGSSGQWATVLIGGLGKGGKSFYALKITNPAGMTSDALVAANVLWEFTDPTMGYSFGSPIAVKTVKYGWVVALTSGYNNSNGYGYLYLVNPANGKLLEKIQTPVLASGLAQASAYVANFGDSTADSIYAGDLDGHLWRFDLTGTSGSYPQPALLATLTDPSGYPQPVTTAPLIEVQPVTRLRTVLVGTGQLLSSFDFGITQTQTFYAITDGTAGAFNASAKTATRSSLKGVTDLTVGIAPSSTSPGWYYDIGGSMRVVVNPVAFNGVVAFSALATSIDACSPSGQSSIFAVNFGTATSVLNPASQNSMTPAVDVALTSSVTSLKFVTNNYSPQLVAGTAVGSILNVPANLLVGAGTKMLSWREIPTVN